MKQIQLTHFRCFANLTVDLKPGVNLLIGDNGSGKTSILRACKYVLNAFFSGFLDADNTKFLQLESEDFQRRENDVEILPEEPVQIDFLCDVSHYDAVPLRNGLYRPGEDGELFTLRKNNSNHHTRTLIAGLKTYREYTSVLLEHYIDKKTARRQYALPVLAAFSTEDIHSSRREGTLRSRFGQYKQKASFGYRECLEGDGFFPLWVHRLLCLQEKGGGDVELDVVRSSLLRALGESGCNLIRDISIRPNQGKVYYQLTDGREVESDLLSDGHRRLIFIVTDLAFRAALLNKGLYGEESALKSRGTVLIDEIDLHLHPSLQATILKGLRAAFPGLQFIVTTHAPMVMTGVASNEENAVLCLRYDPAASDYSLREIETYGLDASTITRRVQNHIPRDSDVARQLNELFEALDNDDLDKGRRLLTGLRERLGEALPELSQAEAIINFFVGEQDAQDHEEG